MSLQDLFSAVREAALPGIWSKGVKGAREERALVESDKTDEVWLKVDEPGRPVAASVILYPDEVEWTCDCEGRVEPCHHVTTAVIAMRRAEQEGKPLTTTTDAQAVLHYQIARGRRDVSLARVLKLPSGKQKPFTGSLVKMLARGQKPDGFAPSQGDIAADRVLSAMLRGDLVASKLHKILPPLADGDAVVEFEGKVVSVAKQPLLPSVRVYDDGDLVVLAVEAKSGVEFVAPMVAFHRGKLRVLGETRLTGNRWERLPLVRQFQQHQLGELVGEILPEFEKLFKVRIDTDRLPGRGERERPRIAFDLKQEGSRLEVLPTLVYGDPVTARIDAGKMVLIQGDVPVRDERGERKLLEALREDLHLVPGRRIELTGSEAVKLASRIRAFAKAHDDKTGGRFFGDVDLAPRLQVVGDRMDIDFVCEDETGEHGGGERGAEPEAVIRAWRQGHDLVPLMGGGWAPLPTEWLQRFGHHVADLLDARDEDGVVHAIALPTLGELCVELDEPPPPGLTRLRPLLEDFDGIPEAELPSDLTATLRGYQVQGVNWLRFLREAGLGAVLADDMGLGKTLQTLCAIPTKSLVVCPRSVIHNWADEIQKFRPGVSVNLYHGPKRELDDSDITLTTYALMRMDIEKLEEVEWRAAVLDEAQAIKNPDSQVARAAYRLNAEFRVSLSGTPVENRLEELWSQLHYTNPGLLGGRRDFLTRYGDLSSEVNAKRLPQRIKPFVLRRLKKDVVPDLPDRTESTMYVELEQNERNVYDAVRAATQKDIVQQLKQGGSVLAALEALLRLRQASCHPSLVPNQHAETSSKIARLLLALEDAAADGHKSLVFSQWTGFLDLVEPHLEEAGVPFLRLDGSTRDRGKVVNAFQSDDGPPVLLISLKAGGTGLNLTAADHVFLLDPWWNPAVEQQAADRAHRIGQTRPVMIYRIVAKDTVEEGILKLQDKKRRLAETALGEAGSATSITREDLLELLV